MQRNRFRDDHFLRSLALTLFALFLIAGLAFGWNSDWKKKVPEAERSRSNPEASDSSAVEAGAKLYSNKCAKCHGENAEGKGRHPSLRSQSVQDSTPGELEWLIQHGNRWHGMPAFGGLSEAERWQIVSYIKSLPATAK